MKVKADVVEKEVVTVVTEKVIHITLTEEEATYLFHGIASMKPDTFLNSIKESVNVYHKSEKHILDNLDTFKLNKVLIDPLYTGLKTQLKMETDD